MNRKKLLSIFQSPFNSMEWQKVISFYLKSEFNTPMFYNEDERNLVYYGSSNDDFSNIGIYSISSIPIKTKNADGLILEYVKIHKKSNHTYALVVIEFDTGEWNVKLLNLSTNFLYTSTWFSFNKEGMDYEVVMQVFEDFMHRLIIFFKRSLEEHSLFLSM